MADVAPGIGPSPLIAEPDYGFLFLSSLLGVPVEDADGVRVGRLDDLVVAMASTFPPVVAFVVRRGRFDPLTLTGRWTDVADLSGPVIRLGVSVRALTPSTGTGADGEVRVRAQLFDRQIVDTNGAKVVRVNDVHFLRVGQAELRLVHVDVGTRGLVRRMGWEARLDGIVRRIAPRAHYLSAERLIRWQYVQPLSLDPDAQSVRLSVVQRELKQLHPADLAEILTDLDGHERASMFRSLDTETAADALAEVDDPRIQTELLQTVSPDHAADILEEMQPDEAADLLGELPDETSDALLHKMEVEEARDVRELLSYPPDTAGGMMTTDLVSLPAELTVEETFARLRREAPDVENIYYLFVVDAEERLVGVLNLRHLILAPPTAALRDIMIGTPAHAHHTDSRDTVSEIVEKYDLLALPVLDDNDILIGMITVDDVVSHIAKQAWHRKLAH